MNASAKCCSLPAAPSQDGIIAVQMLNLGKAAPSIAINTAREGRDECLLYPAHKREEEKHPQLALPVCSRMRFRQQSNQVGCQQQWHRCPPEPQHRHACPCTGAVKSHPWVATTSSLRHPSGKKRTRNLGTPHNAQYTDSCEQVQLHQSAKTACQVYQPIQCWAMGNLFDTSCLAPSNTFWPCRPCCANRGPYANKRPAALQQLWSFASLAGKKQQRSC